MGMKICGFYFIYSHFAHDAETEWQDRFSDYSRKHPDLAREFQQRMRGELPAGWDADIPFFQADPKGMKTRVASGKVMSAMAPRLPSLMGGSRGDVIGLDHFGAPAPGPALMREFGFTSEKVCKRALAVLEKNSGYRQHVPAQPCGALFGGVIIIYWQGMIREKGRQHENSLQIKGMPEGSSYAEGALLVWR